MNKTIISITQEELQLIIGALGLWAAWLETRDVSTRASDCLKAGKEIQILTKSQQQHVNTIDELIYKLYKSN